MNGGAPSVRVPASRTGLRSLLSTQLGPRVSLRRPISPAVLVERAAETFGRIPIYLDKPFDIDPDGRHELDYVEFAGLVERMSGALAAAGVKAWDRVTGVKTSNFDILAIAFAAARLGAIPALISPGLDGDIIGVLLDRLQSPFVLTDQAVVEAAGLPLERWHRPGTRVIGPVERGIALEELWGAPAPPPARRHPEEPLLITHTSSTTGISKLAENSIAGVTFTARVEAMTPFGHSTRELNASCISFVHVRAMDTTMAALSRGTALIGVANPHDDEAVVRLFAKYRPTTVEAHPNTFLHWERLCDHPDEPFANVRIYFNSFDAAHPRTIRRLLGASRRTLPVWFQAYGQTEVQVISVRVETRRSARRLSARGTRSRSLGWPPPGVRLRVADPATQRRKRRGAPGMIQVRTPGRCLRFIGTPDKYWGRRHGPWFDTGDWGRKTVWGDVEIFDRVADRIEGVESCLWIEDVLLDRIPDADEVVVVPDGAGRPAVIVSMRDGAALDPERWEAAVDGLPPLRGPIEVGEADLNRTATSKPRRYLLTELVKKRDSGAFDGGAIPRTTVLREGA